ncbi:MAG TPA: vWA domain-containing protein [Gaiellaceae bacterium]|nr:vWA domain-containing protein [Gaiellaceae bacterium]
MVTRLALAAALVAVAMLELGAARGGAVTEASYLQPGATTVVVMAFSYSITGSTYRLIVNGLRKIEAAGNPVALVGFSDVPYEMLPPGTPAHELEPVARRFVPLPSKDGSPTFPPSPWAPLEGGTKISSGLTLADQILQRDHVRHGSVVLISDLETTSDDASAVVDAVDLLKQHGYPLHLIGLAPTGPSLHFFEGLIGRGGFVDPHTLDAPLQRRDSSGLLSGQTPWSFLFAMVALALLLTVGEHVGAPLELSGVTRRR